MKYWQNLVSWRVMRGLIAIFIFLWVTCLFSQREAANWYFGTHAGLDFNSGTPEILTGGQIRTVEGCETFSDTDGNLLFYTEGNTVWNRFHQVMPNGTNLGGSFSTSQSALVVPNPINPNIYYIFTPDDALVYRLGSPNGFNYSVVNMSLNGGLGDVTTKNFDLLPEGSEKVSAVLGVSGDFYWVITQFRNSFYAFRVDGTGVNTTPVVSTVGPMIDNMENIRGALKISPNGSKLAVAHTVLSPEYASSLYLFDFDTSTGVVSNPQSIGYDRVYYGVEFSSNSTKLYASGKQIDPNDGSNLLGIDIVQFDLEAPDIFSSEYVVHTFPREVGVEISGSLQLGIDKKIYHAVPNSNLSVIRTPNLSGINCDFRLYSVDLGFGSSTYGLPPFIQSLFETIVTIENFCEGDVTTFTTDSTGTIDSMSWDFGDPASGSDNFSNSFNPNHIFSGPGTYTVTIEVDFTNGPPRTFIEFVEIAEIPDVTNSVTLIQCDVDGADDGISSFNLNEAITLFGNGNPDMNGLFFENLSDAQQNINQLDPIGYTNTTNGQLIYARGFENAECYAIVEVILEVQPLSDLGFYKDMPFCAEEPILLAFTMDTTLASDFLATDFPNTQEIYLYSSKEDALLEVNQLPLGDRVFGPKDELAYYFRIEESNNCEFIGRLGIDLIFLPDIEMEVVASLCNGEALLTAPDGYEGYQWSTGAFGQQSIVVEETGEYSVSFSTATCNYEQKFLVEEAGGNAIREIKVSDFRRNNEVVIYMEMEEGDISYSLDGGVTFQSSNRFTNVAPGVYDIVVGIDCTQFEDTAVVGGLPPFFTPNNDGVNDIWTLDNAELFPDFNITIFDRYGRLVDVFDKAELGWDGNMGQQPLQADDYWYKLEFEEGRIVTGHFTLKR